MTKPKIKRGQKYIVRINKTCNRDAFGLGSTGHLIKDSFLTVNGTCTGNLDNPRTPVAIYIRGKDDFPFTDRTDFFEMVPVNIVIQLLD